MIVEIYRRLAMAFNGARCRWAAYVRARSALIIGARGHAKARRHGGDEPSAFRTPGCRSSAAVRSCADAPERAGRRGLLDAGGGGKPAISACGIARRRKSYCRLDRSDLFKPVYCCDKKRCRLVIAEEFEIASRRHSKSRLFCSPNEASSGETESPIEGGGFEPSVPPRLQPFFRDRPGALSD